MNEFVLHSHESSNWRRVDPDRDNQEYKPMSEKKKFPFPAELYEQWKFLASDIETEGIHEGGEVSDWSYLLDTERTVADALRLLDAVDQAISKISDASTRERDVLFRNQLRKEIDRVANE